LERGLGGEVNMADKILLVNKNIGSINVSFTPEYYKRAYNGWINGDLRYLLALIDRAETDGYISGLLTARHAGYKRSYEIAPFRDRGKDPTPQDEDIAGFVSEVFDGLFMREFFEDMIDARMKWYSVISLEWDIINGKQVPVYAEKLHQKYFKYDKKDNILKIDWGKELREIPPDSAFVIEAARLPIMLTVLKEYIMKEFGEESWSSFLEVFGEPFIIAYYPPGADPKIKEETETGVKAIGKSLRGVLPKGTDINIIESKRTGGDHKDYHQARRENISIALLGHMDAAGSDRKMQIGDNTAGIQVKWDIAIDDMYWIEEKIKRFIRMMVNRNFNTNRYPSAIIDKSQSVDAKTKLQAADQALEGGAKIDAKFYKQYGIPIISEDPIQKRTIAQDFGLD
jgi:phage gp29-like protein